MEESTCIASCLICENQLSLTNNGSDGDDTDTRGLVSILKKILLQENEAADVKLEKENSEAIRLFCSACTEILDEWREIQGWISKLLARSEDIKYRLIAYILESNVSLPGQRLDSAVLQELLEDLQIVRRAVIDEYRPSLRLERLEEIPLEDLRNCFDSNFQNDATVDFQETSTGFAHEDYNDEWETPTFDATDSIEFENDAQSDDEVSIKSSSTSSHVMKTRKRKRSPTERHDAGENKRIKRTVVVHENGDILYDGKYNIKLCGNKYACPMCGKLKKGKYHIIEHIRVDHIRVKTHEGDENKQIKRTVVVHKNGDILYDGKYNIKLCGEKYACPMCGLRRKGKYSIIEHIREDHIRAETHEGDENKRIKRPLVELENGDILYDGKCTIKLCGEKYACPFCSVQRQGKYSILDHIREYHTRGKTDVDRKKRTVVELDNGDVIYDEQYTIRLYGDKYLCPLCGLQRGNKYGITDHILHDHIRGNGSNEITSVGQNTFLYLNQYGFTFSKMRYKCTTCGTTENKRRFLIDHIQVSHVNGADEAMGIGKVTDQTVVLPSSVDEYDVNEAESVENTTKDPDLHQLGSSDGEAESEEGSDDEQEPITEDINNSSSGPRNAFRFLPIADNVFLYAGKYRIVLTNGRYQCPKCSCKRRQKFGIMQHIRENHMKCVVSQKVRPFSRIVAINENEFMYGDKFRITKIDNRYHCPECSVSRCKIEALINHIRADHIWKKGKGSNEWTSAGENSFLYLNQYGFTFSDNQYKCTTCGIALKKRWQLIAHIQVAHAHGAEKLASEASVTENSESEDTPLLPEVSETFRIETGQPEDTEFSPPNREVSETSSTETSQPGSTQLSPCPQTDDAFETHRAIQTITVEAVESEACHVQPENQSSEVNMEQATFSASSISEDHEICDKKRNRRTIVELENGDILYDGKYTMRLNGEKYLCPLCGLLRKGKHRMTEHILQDHIRGKGSNEFTSAGENSFLYFNQYGFTFSDHQYKCTTCGIALANRFRLIDHIKASHVNGEDEAMGTGKVTEQAMVLSSSLDEHDVHEPESVENTKKDPDQAKDVSKKVKRQPKVSSRVLVEKVEVEEEEDVSEAEIVEDAGEDPDWHYPDTEDSEVENESLHTEPENEVDVLQETLNQAGKSRGKSQALVDLDNGDLLYGGKYTIRRLHGEIYLCPMCGLQRSKKRSMVGHIRAEHIRGNGSNQFTSAGDNSFLYLNQYGFTFSDNQYKCTTCEIAFDIRKYLINHIKICHVHGADKLASEASTTESSQPKDTQLAPEVRETCKIETSQPEGTQLPPEVSETCTIETSQPEGTQLPPCAQPDDASETLKAIESIKFEAVTSEEVYKGPKNQSPYNGKQATFNTQSHGTHEDKRIRRTVVVLENGDVLYDGKYTIKLCGKKYLCPVCGLKRNKKYAITEHIRADHIVANGPLEITGVGENSFLYLNQYGFSFSNGLYECGTCGLTHTLRNHLLYHIRVSHVDGADKAIHDGKAKSQSSRSLEQDVNEQESVENTEEDPDWHQTDSSDSEAQSEQDSDGDHDEDEPGTNGTNLDTASSFDTASGGPRKPFKCIPIAQNVFLYAGKYRIVFKAGLYKCPKCSMMTKHKFTMTHHIRVKHMNISVAPQKDRIFNRIVIINENEFMYGGKYRIRKINDRYFCSECPESRSVISGVTCHIREEHIRKKEVPETTPQSEEQSSKSKTRYKLTKTGPNEFIYGGRVRISMNDGVFKCGSCGVQMKTLTLMRHHVNHIHIRRANDEFYKSIQPLEDGTFKCGKCDFIGKNWEKMYNHIQSHKNSLKKTGSAELRKNNFSVEVSPNHFDHGGWPYKFVPETGRFNCGSCNYTFRIRPKIVRHIALYHKNPVQSAMCEECGKVFANKDLLRGHKARHRPKTLPCPECGKLFSNQDDLTGHMKIHLGDAAKKNVCEFCGKRFYKLNQLEKHRATHTGEAPYNCDECGLGYRTQRELKNHQSTKHPKETVSKNVPAVDANDAVVSIEIVDGVITDISSV